MRPVHVVDMARTPFLKARGRPGPFSASDLALQSGRALLLRQPFLPRDLDEVILGCAAPAPDEMNIGRILALRLGCGHKVPGWTVMRNCASGMQALDSACSNIRLGRSHLVLAGGTEALSRTPVLFSDRMVNWLSEWNTACDLGQKSRLLFQLRPAHLKPVIGLLKGLTDPVVNLSMGQTAGNLADMFRISRKSMDDYAMQSHQRALAFPPDAWMRIPLMSSDGRIHDTDDGVRKALDPEKLATLTPAFDKPYGQITPGNSSQVTDGAAWLLLASDEAVARWDLKPLASILDVEWAALDPALMGLGPVLAIAPLLARNGLTLMDLDTLEINEAFAAQVLACQEAWADLDWCREQLGLGAPLGPMPSDRLNPHGGAIAIGHPVGATGARLVMEVIRTLHARGGRRGVASLCIGGGQGGAMLLEVCA